MRLPAVCLAALITMAQAPADPLPRASFLGVGSRPPQPGETLPPGFTVGQVFPNSTAAALGVQPGDRIVRINGVAVTDNGVLVAQAGRLRAGQPVTLELVRGAQTRTLRGFAAPRPYESYGAAHVHYGAVPFEGGRLREIYVAPTAQHRGPVIYLIQGYPCSTIESPDPEGGYRPLIRALLERGIAVYRVEKPLMGDSAGTPDCRTTGLDVEVAAFAQGYRHLTGARGVDPDRVFILGHSLGGIEAPLVAARAERPPRGVIAYGTVLKNWADYVGDVVRFQGLMMSGEDPAESEAQAEAMRDTVRELHFGTRSVAELGADPKHAANLRAMGWSAGETITDRHVSYWRDLARQRMAAAWRDTRSQVLSMYGESDIVAIDDEDHRLIAEIVNHYRPGTARFLEVAETEHLMDKVGDRAAFKRLNQTPPQQRPPVSFNPEVARLIADWIGETMTAPPVRTRSFPPPPRAQPA
jgi:hypothetical protein